VSITARDPGTVRPLAPPGAVEPRRPLRLRHREGRRPPASLRGTRLPADRPRRLV